MRLRLSTQCCLMLCDVREFGAQVAREIAERRNLRRTLRTDRETRRGLRVRQGGAGSEALGMLWGRLGALRARG
jgi:hypothetical protein